MGEIRAGPRAVGIHCRDKPSPGRGAGSTIGLTSRGISSDRTRGLSRRQADSANCTRHLQTDSMHPREATQRQSQECHVSALSFTRRGRVAWYLLVLSCVALSSGCHDEREDARAESVPPASVALLDLDGTTVHPLRDPAARFVLFVFTRTDCPISNRYAPEIRRLLERFEPLGVEFVLVYPDASQSATAIREHLASFEYLCRPLRDPRHELVRLAGATVTPEAALFGRDGALLYLGRIDDRFTDFGKARLHADSRDLENALIAVTTNERVPVSRTRAVGCFISDLPEEKRESAGS